MESIHDLDNPYHKLRAAGANFHPVPLPPPEDWVPGPQLFPRQVIAGYHAEYKDYNADSWAAYILKQAHGFAAATSCASWSAINSGTPKDRYWFGYVFRGGHVGVADFQREEGVEGSRAFSV